MLRTFLLLVDLLTNYQAIAAFTRDLLLFGMGNAGLVGLLASVEAVRRSRLHRNDLTASRV